MKVFFVLTKTVKSKTFLSLSYVVKVDLKTEYLIFRILLIRYLFLKLMHGIRNQYIFYYLHLFNPFQLKRYPIALLFMLNVIELFLFSLKLISKRHLAVREKRNIALNDLLVLMDNKSTFFR